MKTILFGYGTGLDYFFKYENSREENNVISIADNNPNQWGKEINKIKIIHPMEIMDLDYDKVVITSRYFIEIYSQLLTMGVPEKKISVTQFFLST